MPIGLTPIFPDLEGKRVLVTGGSAGIGRAAALAFNANGSSLAVLGRRRERLEAVRKQLKHGVSIVADLTKEDDMKRAIEEATDELGGLDILVNRRVPGSQTTTSRTHFSFNLPMQRRQNAAKPPQLCNLPKDISHADRNTDLLFSGGVATDDMFGKDENAFLSAFQLHVTGNLTLIRSAEEELIKNKGAVVNISSAGSLIPAATFSSYGVAKAALGKLTKDLAFEFAPKGVRINSILAGVVNTESFDSTAEQMGISRAEIMARLAPHHAQNRVAEPEEIAGPILFLASSAASFITGASLLVDGGATLGYWFNRKGFLE